jgi:hypothetical protein
MADIRTKTTIKWDGDIIKRRAAELMKKSTFEIGLFVEGQAKLLAPRKSGRLAGSITTVSASGQKTSPSGKGAVASDTISPPPGAGLFDVYVGTPLEYAPYIEYGTVRSEAQAFLRPALDIAYGRVPTIVEKNGKIYFEEYLK